MRVQSLHEGFIMPTKGTDKAGAFDIYMPEAGRVCELFPTTVPLGFSAEVPPGHVALLLPRSGVGSRFGLELMNTAGVIDADYRGEWKAVLKTKGSIPYAWTKHERVLQFMIVPVLDVTLELVDALETTSRGVGGFGSSGK